MQPRVLNRTKLDEDIHTPLARIDRRIDRGVALHNPPSIVAALDVAVIVAEDADVI